MKISVTLFSCGKTSYIFKNRIVLSWYQLRVREVHRTLAHIVFILRDYFPLPQCIRTGRIGRGYIPVLLYFKFIKAYIGLFMRSHSYTNALHRKTHKSHILQTLFNIYKHTHAFWKDSISCPKFFKIIPLYSPMKLKNLHLI